jgi:hypothetical protein
MCVSKCFNYIMTACNLTSSSQKTTTIFVHLRLQTPRIRIKPFRAFFSRAAVKAGNRALKTSKQDTVAAYPHNQNQITVPRTAPPPEYAILLLCPVVVVSTKNKTLFLLLPILSNASPQSPGCRTRDPSLVRSGSRFICPDELAIPEDVRKCSNPALALQ